MSSHKSHVAIGGYFGLELRKGQEFHADAIALNSARNSFEYILKIHVPAKVFIPKYTCDVMLEPLEKLHIPYEFYAIDERLEITEQPELEAQEMIVYTNYFGVKDSYCDQISKKYGRQLIVDCSQAFYYQPPKGVHGIYSPRKFFGVADGGYAVTDTKLQEEFVQDISYGRMDHLLKRIDRSPEEGFEDYKKNDQSLVGQPIKSMSKLTHALLRNVDYEAVRATRKRNFTQLHEALGNKNELSFEMNDIDAPMVYPYLVDDGAGKRKMLIENRVYTAMYWPNVLEWCAESELEYTLATNLLAIPVDQRYGEQEMAAIMEYLT